MLLVILLLVVVIKQEAKIKKFEIITVQPKHKRYVALYVDSTKNWVLDSIYR
jgi:uncharacterized protein YlbG (UPF0298 family)